MRRIISLILALWAAVSFCGCHGRLAEAGPDVGVTDAGEAAAYPVPEAFDTETPIEITFWAKNDSNKTQTGVYQKAIADFQTLYPNVTVKLKLYTDYGRIYNDVITNISTNTTPNVCITYPDHIATYITGEGNMVPLDSFITDERYGLGGKDVLFDSPTVEETVPRFLLEGRIGGVQYAIPFMRSTEACYVNRTYVEALGFTLPETLTWDFIWQVSEAALETDADGNYKVNGQKVMIPFIYKSTDNMMIQLLRQNDFGYSDGDGGVYLFNEGTRGILRTVSTHAASGAFSTFKRDSYPANYLNAGQCIFAIDSTAGATWMGTDAPLLDIDDDRLVEFETEVMMLPQVNTDSPEMISQGPSVCVFNKDDPQVVLASWLFAQFLLTDEVQVEYAKTEGYIPVTLKAQESESYRDYLSRAGEDSDLYYSVKMDATSLLLDNVDNTFVTPVFNGSASLRNAAGHLIEAVVLGAKRGDSVDGAYIDALFSETVSLYKIENIRQTEDGTGYVETGTSEDGALPLMSVVLLSSIGALWLILGVYYLKMIINKNNSRNISA